MSRHYSSRRAYADAIDDYENFAYRLPRQREHHHVHEPRSALSPRGMYRSSDTPVRKVTVTSHRIHTSGESTTSYHDHRVYTTYGSSWSPVGYQELSDEDHRDPTRRKFHSAEEGRRYPSYAHVKNSHPEDFERAYRSGYSRKPRSHGSDEHGRSDTRGQEKPNKSSSRRGEQQYNSRNNTRWEEYSRSGSGQEKPNKSSSRRGEQQYNSRNNTRREEYSRSGRSDSYYEDREQRYHQGGPKEPKPTSKGHNGKSRSYRNHKKPDSSRTEGRREGIPGSNRRNSSHEASQPKTREIFPDYYATLKLSHLATEEEIKRAAKLRRIEVHPDRLKKPEMSAVELAQIDSVATQVGQAADVLLNPEQKQKYDRELYAAKGY